MTDLYQNKTLLTSTFYKVEVSISFKIGTTHYVAIKS